MRSERTHTCDVIFFAQAIHKASAAAVEQVARDPGRAPASMTSESEEEELVWEEKELVGKDLGWLDSRVKDVRVHHFVLSEVGHRLTEEEESET